MHSSRKYRFQIPSERNSMEWRSRVLGSVRLNLENLQKEEKKERIIDVEALNLHPDGGQLGYSREQYSAGPAPMNSVLGPSRRWSKGDVPRTDNFEMRSGESSKKQRRGTRYSTRMLVYVTGGVDSRGWFDV
ncbi:hypothetical protein B0H16DRAFT_1448095 [Mycena metata]|uniref:Uncharacterized protein n=1 Tax=Mycena metata TaxID=1033252 RepID=A0AAD7K772_9AGAR|nr:hypothetical protein B0H16DRAFT_1448095 [Mycena metata]